MPPAPTYLCPLIQVFDMPVSVAFYRAIGFEVVDDSGEIEAAEGRYFHWCWLRSGEANLMLNTAYDEGERPPHRDAPRWSGHGDTCLYIGTSDVQGVYAELAAKGLTVEPPRTAPYSQRQLHLIDPDGYVICFQQAL